MAASPPGASCGFPSAPLPYPLTDPVQSDMLATLRPVRDRMHFRQWKRREVITLLGGAAAAWPLAARAQQAANPLVGYLSVGSPESDASRLTGLRRGLNEIG